MDGFLRRARAHVRRAFLPRLQGESSLRPGLSLHDLGVETSSQDYIFYVYDRP
jgi:hypothetical protein